MNETNVATLHQNVLQNPLSVLRLVVVVVAADVVVVDAIAVAVSIVKTTSIFLI
jgi:hypothetical protein